MKKFLTLLLSAAMLLCLFTGCKNSTSGTPQATIPTTPDVTSPTVVVDYAQEDTDMFSDRDLRQEYDSAGSVQIKLEGSSVSCSSPGVSITGSEVSITKEGTYILSGTLNDGCITINAGEKDKVQLVLNGASITNRTAPAIFAVSGDKLFVTSVSGTENTISNGGSFLNTETDAAIFARMDLTVNGAGKLTVESPAGHGITCKDDLIITGGDLTINTAFHGLDANDSIRITAATLNIDSGKDGIHAENNDDEALGFVYISSGTFSIEAEGDGISAASTLQINSGTYNLLTGGGSENASKDHAEGWGNPAGGPGKPGMRATAAETDTSTSMKGIKAGAGLLISDGTFTINSADDSIHAADVVINGGTYQIAAGDDAIHADETLQITNGTINITESYEGLEAHHVIVSGGNISMTCDDDGINAAGGNDSSGTQGRDPMEQGGRPMGPGGFGATGDGSVTISGGILNIISSGDGIDANGTLTISGGKTTITGPTQGDTATLDFDVSGGICGGTFIGTGGSMMAQTFSDSSQGVISLNVGNQAASTTITLSDASGNTLISHSPTLPFAIVILSTPDMVKGADYTVTIGDVTETFTAE